MTHFFNRVIVLTSSALVLAACSGADSSTAQPTSAAKKVEASSAATAPAPAPQSVSNAVSQKAASRQAYNAFLKKYVRTGGEINFVAYGDVTAADEKILESYISGLTTTDISSYSDDEIKAYWFNLYNAVTVDLILKNYPLDSIRKIRRPWDQNLLTVNGVKMSLNDIEHKTLRKTYKEPRIHFAVNCASIGCPNLKASAWDARTLEADLDQAARDYVASARGITVRGNDIIASSIFKWYKEDFGSNEREVLAYLSQFADGPKKAAMQSAKGIKKYDYDWSLNEPK